MPKFLIIQTAFIGDVVLATAIAEKLRQYHPSSEIHFLLRRGNETLLKGHPTISKVLVWDKKTRKTANLIGIIRKVRSERYTHVINAHRFASSGLITSLSGAGYKSGFDKNPFSFCYTRKVKHIISPPYTANPVHETDRNQMLIADLTDQMAAKPHLSPGKEDFDFVRQFRSEPYICIAPSSVWFTKQFPVEKWVELVGVLPAAYPVYLLGAPSDKAIADDIIRALEGRTIKSFCGELSFLQSAALMQSAAMNYVNDSAPLHFASAVNAPVTAVYCSTVPAFGFGPLSDRSSVVEIEERLYCRPCGLHGYRTCPEGHFRCALEIKNEQLLWWISKQT